MKSNPPEYSIKSVAEMSDREFIAYVESFEPAATGFHPIWPGTLKRLLTIAKENINDLPSNR